MPYRCTHLADRSGYDCSQSTYGRKHLGGRVELPAAHQQVDVARQAERRVGVVEVSGGEALEHPELDAGVLEQAGDEHEVGLGHQRLLEQAQVAIGEIVDQLVGHAGGGAVVECGEHHAGHPVLLGELRPGRRRR